MAAHSNCDGIIQRNSLNTFASDDADYENHEKSDYGYSDRGTDGPRSALIARIFGRDIENFASRSDALSRGGGQSCYH
jgi:hypothetical protein